MAEVLPHWDFQILIYIISTMISCVGPRPQTRGLYTVTMLIKSSLQIQMRGRVKLISRTLSSWCSSQCWQDCSRLGRWIQNLQLIIETWRVWGSAGLGRSQSYRSFIGSPTVLWTMFFFMSLSFFLLTLFSNLWIATGHKSMWIRHLAYFKILATLPDNTHTVYFPWTVIHTRLYRRAWWQSLGLSPA